MRYLILLALAWLPATIKPPTTYSWLPGPFLKAGEPILRTEVDQKNQPNPTVLSVDGRYHLLYDSGGLLYHASSDNGQNFSTDPDPVFGPTEWYEKGGVEDPRLAFINNLYYLTYTGYDGPLARVCLASSPDLKGWKKHGPLFPSFPPNARRRYSDGWTRCATILPDKLRNRYVMLFGDSDLWLATSDDLLNWNYRPQSVLTPEKNQDKLEMGPLIRRKEGLVAFYNATDARGRTSTYAALLADYDPTTVLERADTPLLEPTQKWEQNVTSTSALLFDGATWSLFYSGADRAIGLARANR